MSALAAANPRKFVASKMQWGFFDWVKNGSGSATLKAVAGSGKSTSIVRALEYVDPRADVLILAFNSPIAKEMREKIAAFGEEIGRSFHKVDAATFHSRGFKALCRAFGRDVKVEVDDGKVRKILKDRLSDAELDAYGDFVKKLVGFAKGVGVGIPGLATDEVETWENIVETQELWLDAEGATVERAIEIAQKALAASNAKAKAERWIDFDDQLYLPLLWNLRLFRHEWVFVDEAQDTNPVRREFALRSLKDPKAAKFPGRAVFVGDPRQSIYAFTGASSNAMDLIAERFETRELPLTVSYRCPKAVAELVRRNVPYFEVAADAPEGEVLELPLKKVLEKIGPSDAILCRNTAPLISLAFSLIATGRGCFVLGKDIGADLAGLIRRLRPNGVPNLLERLDGWLAKERAEHLKADKPMKADAASDRAGAIRAVIAGIPYADRTVPNVLAKIEELFADGSGEPRLVLSTIHKAKGREFPNVAVLMPELSPSKNAKSDDAYQQELNLEYVRDTRTRNGLYFIKTEARR